MEESRGLAGKGITGYKWSDGLPYCDSTILLIPRPVKPRVLKKFHGQVRVYRMLQNTPQGVGAVDWMDGRQQSIPAKSAR